MGEQRDLAGWGQRWSGLARVIGMVIALAALFGVGRFFYEETWQSKVLTYTILPSYDQGGQFFTGLVIENRGRLPLSGVRITLSGLGAPFLAPPYMPGVHEPADLVGGGAGDRDARIEMGRLPTGGSLSVYILTSDEVSLEWGKTLLVSSAETTGVPSAGETGGLSLSSSFLLLVLLLVVSGFSVYFGVMLNRERKERLEFQIKKWGLPPNA